MAVIPALLDLVTSRAGESLERRSLRGADAGRVRRMSWQQFERYLVGLFRGLGYQVSHTPYQGDLGADLIITMPGGVRIAVQAKHWRANVGNKAVQEAHTAAAVYGCQYSMVIATSGYTKAARQTADATGTVLWTMVELAEAQANATKRRQQLAAKR